MSKPQEDNTMKWYYIGFGAFLVAIMFSEAYDTKIKSDATRDVVVACYKSGTKDCDSKWANGLK